MKKLAVLALYACSALAAEDQMLVAGAVVDSSIAAPTLEWRVNRNNGDAYRLGISGWTIDGSWRRKALVLSADVTPIHAHNSNRIYVNGDRAADYDNASYRVKAGVRLAATEINVVGLSERVDNVDPAIARFWDKPYVGLEIAHTYSAKTAENPLIAAWDGVELSARGETYAGRESWSRLSLSEATSRTFGRIDLRQSLTLLNGKSLNVVNRFLVGGSWDVLGGTALYGSRYGEYRVQRAAIANGGADYLLPQNWRAGVRGSYMRSDAANTWGTAINASTTWRTFGLNMGVGFPENGDPLGYISVVAPLYRR